MDFVSVNDSPARAERDQANKNKSKAGILALVVEILVAIFIIKDLQYKNRKQSE